MEVALRIHKEVSSNESLEYTDPNGLLGLDGWLVDIVGNVRSRKIRGDALNAAVVPVSYFGYNCDHIISCTFCQWQVEQICCVFFCRGLDSFGRLGLSASVAL